jgi:hypothetical protein
MLDGSGTVYDREEMTDIQSQIARRRLILGISNVGFWVATSAAGLLWCLVFGSRSIDKTALLKCMLGMVAVQSLFDFIGGVIFVPPVNAGYSRFFQSDKKSLFAPFPQLARAVSSRGALKGELLVRVRNMGRISSRSTSF